MRKVTGFFANGGRVHLALRQLRDEFSQPITLAALAGVAVVVGILGPFTTLESLPLLPRMAYWAVVVPLTYAAGFLGTVLARPLCPAQPRALHIALVAAPSSLMVALVLGSLNAALGILPETAGQAALGLGSVYVICLVIEGVGAVLAAKAPPAPHIANPPATTHAATTHPATTHPAILQRLPMEKRGALLALSAEDHYTRIITSKGQDMVLIRLADAIAEAAPVAGVQIHRSHWVALAGVARTLRTGDGAMAVLMNGEQLPIARTRLQDARRAGLLPKKGPPLG